MHMPCAYVSYVLYMQMDKVFDGQGVSCPPWRQYKVMVTSWLVAKAEDVRIHGKATKPQDLATEMFDI